MLTQAYLKECVSYNPETGAIVWKARPDHHFKTPLIAKAWNDKHSGNIAGSIRQCGYRVITINRHRFRAHRLAFLYMNGSLPQNHTDHINGIRHDNRWLNIRAVTNKENCKNQKKRVDNTSGVTGVYWHKSAQKWRSMIQNNGRLVSLGLFDDINEAIKARKDAEKLYGYHENHGRHQRS